MAALITVLIGSIVGELNIYFAIAFFWIYLSYVTVVVIMDRYERKAQKLKEAERREDTKIEKIPSLNPEDDSLVSSNSEKSDDEDKDYFYEKAVSQNVNGLGDHLIEKESDTKRALTQDSSGDQEQNNGSGNEWSMVIKEPNASQDEEHHQEPQGKHIGKP